MFRQDVTPKGVRSVAPCIFYRQVIPHGISCQILADVVSARM